MSRRGRDMAVGFSTSCAIRARYPNIFGLGDCTNAPTSKTAAGAGTVLLIGSGL
jgi:hypothetical protein